MREENKKNNYLLTACCNNLHGFLLATQVILPQPAHSAEVDTDNSASAFASVNTEKSVATYQVRRNDRLLTIAKRLKPADAHYYQVAVALWLKNPDAFTNNSPGKLKANKLLLLPTTEEIRAHSIREAGQSIRSGNPPAKPKTTRQARKNNGLLSSELKSPRRREKISSQSPKPSKRHQKPYILTLLEQKLQDEVNTINDQTRSLEQKIPTPLAQKQAKMQYLESLHDLQQQLIANTAAQKFALAAHQKKLNNTSPNYNTSLLTQKLRAEIDTINNQIINLERRTPTSLAQKQARVLHLESLTDLQQRLSANNLKQKRANTAYKKELSTLFNKQKKLKQEHQEQKKVLTSLQAAARKADFLVPRNISYANPKTENSFFKRIAVSKRWQHAGSPLLHKAEQLYCATDQKQASTLLNQLFDISAPGVGWPDEWLGQKPDQAVLRSATLDILLAALHGNIERFPTLAELTERVVLQWDYCDITGEGSGLYDLSWHKEQLTAVKAQLPLLKNSIGFNNWGFSRSPDEDANRYIPKLLEAREPYHAFEIFFHRVYRKQCFPHPETGKVYTEVPTAERILSREFTPPQQELYGEEYPHQWQPLCDIPHVNYATRSEWPPILLRQAKQQLSITAKKLSAIKLKVTNLKKEHHKQQKSMLLTNKALDQEMNLIKSNEEKRQTKLKTLRDQADELNTLVQNKRQQINNIANLRQEYHRQQQPLLLANEALRQEISAIQSKEDKRQTKLKKLRSEVNALQALAQNKKQQIHERVTQAQKETIAKNRRTRTTQAQKETIAESRATQISAAEPRSTQLAIEERKAIRETLKERRIAQIPTAEQQSIQLAIAKHMAVKQAAIQRALKEEAKAVLLQEFTAATQYLVARELKQRSARRQKVPLQMVSTGIKGKKAARPTRFEQQENGVRPHSNSVIANVEKTDLASGKVSPHKAESLRRLQHDSPGYTEKQKKKPFNPSNSAVKASKNKGQTKQQTTSVLAMRTRLSQASEVNFNKQQKTSVTSLRDRLAQTTEVNFATLNAPPNGKKTSLKNHKQLVNKNNKQDAVPTAPKSKEKLGITATALYTIPVSGDKPFGKLSASWKPKTNWFIRGAAKYTGDEGFTYSWGAGYSDWRPGTTSVQLNNWGPIKPGEGLDIDDAIFSISHKVDADLLHENKLSLTLGVSKPISGDMAFNATFQWNPVKNWYFRTTASQKLKGGPTKWSYGFGYYDWRPGTWRVEYSNYENNRYPFDNFREGAITINRAWEF